MNLYIFLILFLLILSSFIYSYFRRRFYKAQFEETTEISQTSETSQSKTSRIQRRIVKHQFAKQSGSGVYEIWEIHNVLSEDECKELIQFALAKGLEESTVWNHTSQGNASEKHHRKSQQTWLKNTEHLLAEKISKISEELTGIDMSHQELLQVARYDTHGMFNDHYDACDSESNPENCAKMNQGCGQRKTTLLLYLNDDFEGGETEFVGVPFKCVPKIGKGLLFWNVDDNDILIKESKHRGNQVLTGYKWIANKWSHSKPWVK